jgi:hypothetical protein
MTWARSALLMLIACMLLGPSSRGSEHTGYPADRAHSLMTGGSEALVGWLDVHSPSRRVTLSQFTPWKTRIKSVLEETKQRVIEEFDLGPIILSGQLFTSGSVDRTFCLLPTRLPLRC